MAVQLSDIQEAAGRISSVIHSTQMQRSRSCSERADANIYLKFENQQLTGSFKIRGALNRISQLTDEEKARGIIACSAGNHAQGVAVAAQRLNVQSTVVMPATSPLIKVQATRGYGARVILHGDFYDEAHQLARQLENEKGYTFVHPYDDFFVIAGQGTLGLEILGQLPEVDCVLVPIGGGGLISGVATAIKSIRPQCRIIGVQTEIVPSMANYFRTGAWKEIETKVGSIADGIAVKRPSQNIYETYIRRLVDDVVTVSEDEIAEAIVFLLERTKSVVEGAGAVGMAAAFAQKRKWQGNVCVPLCGGNIDLNTIAKTIERGLSKGGRLAEFSVIVDDRPGQLSQLARVIAEKRGNVLQVHHDRLSRHLLFGQTRIDFLVETSSTEHAVEIQTSLSAEGAVVRPSSSSNSTPGQ